VQGAETADQIDEGVGRSIISRREINSAVSFDAFVGGDARRVCLVATRQRGFLLLSTGTGNSQRSCWWRGRRHDGCLAAMIIYKSQFPNAE
jgi:hypothetical protein